MKTLLAALATSLALFGCSGTDSGSDDGSNGNGNGDGNGDGNGSETATLTLEGGDALPSLGSDYVYEGWIVSDGPKSTGRFSIQDGESTYEWEISSELAEAARGGGKFVLTIEPKEGDEEKPSATKFLAGAFQDGSATATVANEPALGSDLSEASGTFLLNTPSDGKADNYKYGIWFLEAGSSGKSASLDLPELPEGWKYEGWVANSDGAWTTGKFTSATGFDSDKAGPESGPKDGPKFPGQDYLGESKRDLTSGYKAVISIEPDPDNSDKPFALKPLRASISDAGKGKSQELENKAEPPSVTVNVE